MKIFISHNLLKKTIISNFFPCVVPNSNMRYLYLAHRTHQWSRLVDIRLDKFEEFGAEDIVEVYEKV